MTVARDDLSKARTVTVAVIEAAVPTLVLARDLVASFHTLIRQKKAAALDGWLEQAGQSLVASFARGLAPDNLAVRAAIATAWSNAQAEGQITKLKLVKRQMYGRGKLDLLQARAALGGLCMGAGRSSPADRPFGPRRNPQAHHLCGLHDPGRLWLWPDDRAFGPLRQTSEN